MGGNIKEEGTNSDSEQGIIQIGTTLESLDGALLFHLIKELVGFVLFMNQQIPSILQDLSFEFDELQTERKDLEFVLTQTKVASLRRKHNGRMREVKQGIKRLQKFMDSVSKLQEAIKLMLDDIDYIQGMLFSHGRVVQEQSADYAKSRVSEALSRKAIRALISKGAGTVSYRGPTKLFLLIKAPITFNLPLHFLPKRDFRYSKKVVPFRLRVKCNVQDNYMPTSAGFLWFQCKHSIKGLSLKNPEPEE
ncbi:hypothetical protein ACHQM5_027083 [Ranunculus cassubicifolius]